MARLFVDNLTVMDFSYLDADRGLVGESWIVDVELGGELDEQGMVFDFGHVKKQIKQYVDDQADHRLLVPVESAGCSTELVGDQLHVAFKLNEGGVIRHESPADAVWLVASETIESADIASKLEHQILALLPNNVKEVRIRLRAESISDAFFHYSHGLQKHLGQCQRIAHGHRSRLEISVGGDRSAEEEARWASRLKDIYLATESHVVGEQQHEGITHVQLAYRAAQGEFALEIPASQVMLMPCISTVENIAMYLAEQVASDVSGRVLVKAFEGVNKGAFGEAQ